MPRPEAGASARETPGQRRFHPCARRHAARPGRRRIDAARDDEVAPPVGALLDIGAADTHRRGAEEAASTGRRSVPDLNDVELDSSAELSCDLLDELHARLIEGVDDEGATLDRFSVRARDGYFYVSGAVSKSEGTVNFSFRVVPSMFHTRPGAYFPYARKPRSVHSRTWPALGFRIEGVETNVDRAWWVILFGEVIVGILTVGLSILYIEGMVSAAASSFGGRIAAAKPGAPANRVQRTIPPPGGTGVRIGLDHECVGSVKSGFNGWMERIELGLGHMNGAKKVHGRRLGSNRPEETFLSGRGLLRSGGAGKMEEKNE